MSAAAGTVDLRAFRWRLAGLDRKLDHELECTRSALAALQREAASLDALRHEMTEAHFDALRKTSKLLADAVDPVAHRACLQYLAATEDRLRERSDEAGQLDARVMEARKACLDADRRLASLRSLRQDEEADYTREQSRRIARDADLAWLALAATRDQAAARRGGRAE